MRRFGGVPCNEEFLQEAADGFGNFLAFES